MDTRLRYSVWKVFPPQMSQIISAARRSSSASPPVQSHSPKPNGQRQRTAHSLRTNSVLNSKRTRPSWGPTKPLRPRPPIQTRAPYMLPLPRHMLQHQPLPFQFLLCRSFPQVRLQPSLACHRLRALSQEYLPSRRQFRACQACLLGTFLQLYLIPTGCIDLLPDHLRLASLCHQVSHLQA